MDPAQLDDVPAFADLTDEERAEVAACLREVTVEAGAPLATQGDNAWEWFVIRSGQAEVRKDGEFVRTLEPGEVFGELGLLATGTRTASVVASSPMELLAMFLRDFRGLEQRLPALAASVREQMAENAARTGL